MDVDIKSVLLVLSPVRNGESFEEGSRSSVETDISDSLVKSGWMEILSINVKLNVWFLEELVGVDVLHSETSFSGFLNVELISEKGKIWVKGSHDLRSN